MKQVSANLSHLLLYKLRWNVSFTVLHPADVVDRGGFEPPASAVRERRSYRTDLPAHRVFTKKGFAEDLDVSVAMGFGAKVGLETDGLSYSEL
jgi:hypothetical protein